MRAEGRSAEGAGAAGMKAEWGQIGTMEKAGEKTIIGLRDNRQPRLQSLPDIQEWCDMLFGGLLGRKLVAS